MSEKEIVEKETKVCKYCKTEIDKDAKICPNCKKKQGGKLKWIIIAIVVVLILGAAMDSSEQPKNEDTTKTDTQSESKTDEKKSEKSDKKKEKKKVDNVFKVGETVKTDNLKIAYKKSGTFVSDNQFVQPKSGKKYIRAEFEIENIGKSDQTFSSMVGWECYADGYAMKGLYTEDDSLNGTISSGKKIKGALYFEVPKDAKEINIEYETNFITAKKVIFKVK